MTTTENYQNIPKCYKISKICQIFEKCQNFHVSKKRLEMRANRSKIWKHKHCQLSQFKFLKISKIKNLKESQVLKKVKISKKFRKL